MPDAWLTLPPPPSWTPAARRAFLRFADRLAQSGLAGAMSGTRMTRSTNAGVVAACHVLADLAEQGWELRVADQAVAVRPPESEVDSAAEKTRVRRQELLKRDEQLTKPSVRKFIAEMERPREFLGRFVSIF